MYRCFAALVALLMVSSACSPAAEPGSAPIPSSTRSPTFTLADQEELSDAVTTSALAHGWVAGCLWAAGTSRPLKDALLQLQLANRPGFRLSKRAAHSGAVMVIVVRDGRGTTSEGFDEVAGAGFLCYRLVGTALLPNRA